MPIFRMFILTIVVSHFLGEMKARVGPHNEAVCPLSTQASPPPLSLCLLSSRAHSCLLRNATTGLGFLKLSLIPCHIFHDRVLHPLAQTARS